MSLESSSNSILSDIDSSSFTESPNSNSILSFFQSIPWTIWVLLLIVLAFLGFNIFSYLAIGTQDVASIFSNISVKLYELLGIPIANTAKQTIEVSAVGAKAGIDVLANSVIPQTAASTQQPSTVEKSMQQQQENTLNKSLNNAEQNMNSNQVEADDSYSSIQMNKSSGKNGWCYIGEDRGFRSCIEVGPNDECMSGDIFPTSAVCVNPNLRP